MKAKSTLNQSRSYGWIMVVLLIFFIGGILSNIAKGATNIDSGVTAHWAWNDVIGWIDFYNTNSVTVLSSQLEGYASSSAGDISLDCATTRLGNICGASDYRVVNDGLGNLSGWAWSDSYGWISFSCTNTTSGCGISNYGVWIDSDTGDFNNYAWNDVIGWISFNCGNYGGCGSSNYKVLTSWRATSTSGTLDSSTFDTEVSGGAQINSILWQGSYPTGTAVRFQFATSNSSSGPWSFIGPDGTSSSYYSSTGAGYSTRVSYTLHNNQRYFRYRIILYSNQAQTSSPRVDDVVVNWSP